MLRVLLTARPANTGMGSGAGAGMALTETIAAATVAMVKILANIVNDKVFEIVGEARRLFSRGNDVRLLDALSAQTEKGLYTISGTHCALR